MNSSSDVASAPTSFETGAAQASGRRARAAPPRWRRPPSRAQRERKGEAAQPLRGSPLTRLPDFLFVLPLDRAFLHIKQLERELVVHVLGRVVLLDDAGQLAFHAVLGGRHLADLGGGTLLVQTALVLALQLVHTGLHLVDGAHETHLARLDQRGLDRVHHVGGVDVFAGLVLHGGDRHRGAALEDAGFEQTAGHLLGNHLQVGGAEFVGHQLDGLGIAVVDLAVKTHGGRGQVLAGRQGQGAGRKGQDQRAALDAVLGVHVGLLLTQTGIGAARSARLHIHFQAQIDSRRGGRHALDCLLAQAEHAHLLPGFAIAHLVAHVVQPLEAVEHGAVGAAHVGHVGLHDQDVVLAHDAHLAHGDAVGFATQGDLGRHGQRGGRVVQLGAGSGGQGHREDRARNCGCGGSKGKTGSHARGSLKMGHVRFQFLVAGVAEVDLTADLGTERVRVVVVVRTVVAGSAAGCGAAATVGSCPSMATSPVSTLFSYMRRGTRAYWPSILMGWGSWRPFTLTTCSPGGREPRATYTRRGSMRHMRSSACSVATEAAAPMMPPMRPPRFCSSFCSTPLATARVKPRSTMPGISSLSARRAITFTSTTFSSLRSVPAAEMVVSSGSEDGSITGYEMLAVTMPRPVGTGNVKALGLRAGASPASTTNNTS